jgi:D-lactate dehydrogenase (cytochrome)
VLTPITDPSVIAGYLTDASNLRGHAEALCRPTSTAEVAAVVRHCQAHNIPLTVTAQRTSTTGGPVPRGGWLLSTEALSEIRLIGHDTATAGAGVLLGALQTEIEARGRFFPPDPTSRHECTLGAAIACNASGARSFRYGATRPWVVSLDIVLPSGEVITVRRGDPVPAGWPVAAWPAPSVKSAAGYAGTPELIDLFIGQEGTLGVVTEATVRLTDLPADVIGMLLFFPDRPSAVDFMRAARAAALANPEGDLSPRCLEYLDHHCLDLARARGAEVPEGARAALFCEQEVHDAARADAHLAAWWELLSEGTPLADATLLATDDTSRQRLLALRHAIPAGINERVVANGMPKLGTDLSVPDSGLDAMMDAYEAAPIDHVLFGHLGDNHLHLNLLPRTEAELTVARAFYDDLARLAIRLGGSVSAEHGIGKVKVRQLGWMVGPEVLEGYRALKHHLDPHWILGRGNVLSPPEVTGAV